MTFVTRARARSQRQPTHVLTSLIPSPPQVCSGHAGNESFTTVAEFQVNVLAALDELNTVLPAGSHVAFIGLADGRVLFNSTHNKIHPLGVTYPEVYEYLSCNNCNPCWGWLNTNSTWRDATSQRAAELSDVYDSIIAANATRWSNFDMYHVHTDWVAFIQDYVAAGGNATDLIEPVDGFHPSQTGNVRATHPQKPDYDPQPSPVTRPRRLHRPQQMLLSKIIWEDIATNMPSFLPPINPNNAAIAARFGAQLNGY